MGDSLRKHAIAAAFARAAPGYEQHATLQRLAADGLATRIAALTLPPAPHLLEIGCGTGLLTRALHTACPAAASLVTDLAPVMVAQCRANLPAGDLLYAAMDAEAPSLAGPRFDLIAGSLVAQWFTDLPATLSRLHALLRPCGWLALASLGPASFAEWRAAHAAEGLRAATPGLPGTAAFAAWPGETRIDTQTHRLAYQSGLAFLRGLRAIGADTPRAGATPLLPGQLRRVLRRFEAESAATTTYEIIFAFLRCGG